MARMGPHVAIDASAIYVVIAAVGSIALHFAELFDFSAGLWVAGASTAVLLVRGDVIPWITRVLKRKEKVIWDRGTADALLLEPSSSTGDERKTIQEKRNAARIER